MLTLKNTTNGVHVDIDYTLEDLLDLVEKDSEKSPDLLPQNDSNVIKFIKEFKIRGGVDRIPTYVVYYTYKERFGGFLSKIEFFRQFKKEFIQRRTGKQRVYLLGESSFDMSREGLIEAKFHNKGSK